jgi:broad specificity phosphatase PhoE
MPLRRSPPPTVVLFVRHGLTPTTGKEMPAPGPGPALSDHGRQQAEEAGAHIARLRRHLPPLEGIYTSPLARTRETATIVGKALDLQPIEDPGLVDCDAGDWAGAELKQLASKPEWQTVVHYPSGFRFPGGEALAGMRARAGAAVMALVEAHRGKSLVVVSHADPIKAVLADAFRERRFVHQFGAQCYGRQLDRGFLPSRRRDRAGTSQTPPGRRRLLSASFDMPRPGRVTVGAVGPPGRRVFYFQARQDDRLLSLKLEKEHVLFLAGGLSEVLADLASPAGAPQEEELQLEQPVDPAWAVGSIRLLYDPAVDRVVLVAREAPEAEGTGAAAGPGGPGAGGAGAEPGPGPLGDTRESFSVVGSEYEEEDGGEDEDEGEGDDDGPEYLGVGAVARVALTREQAAGVIEHGKRLLRSGRPPCPLCGYPLGDSHSCPKTNGHRAPSL